MYGISGTPKATLFVFLRLHFSRRACHDSGTNDVYRLTHEAIKSAGRMHFLPEIAFLDGAVIDEQLPRYPRQTNLNTPRHAIAMEHFAFAVLP